MNAADIVTLLERLNCHHIKARNAQWVTASCPFAPFTNLHKNRRDKNPSFGISVKDGHSGYRCFTCGVSGNLTHMLFRLKHYAEQNEQDTTELSELFTWAQARDQETPKTIEGLKERLKTLDYKAKGPIEVGGILVTEDTAKHVFTKPSLLEESELDNFQPLSEEPFNYLRKRRLTEQTIKEWGFRWHPGARRIAIPIRDVKQRLVGISGRSLDGESKRKFLHSAGFTRDCYLFGEHRLKEGGVGRGIVVEGFFDAIYLWQQGYPAVALMGTYPSAIQVEKLVRFFNEVAVLPDGDDPGYEAADRVARALSRRMSSVNVLPMPKGRDPDELDPLDLLDLFGDPMEPVSISSGPC